MYKIIPIAGGVIDIPASTVAQGSKCNSSCWLEFYSTTDDAINSTNPIITGLGGKVTITARPSLNTKWMKLPDDKGDQIVLDLASDDPALSWQGQSVAQLNVVGDGITGASFIKLFYEGSI